MKEKRFEVEIANGQAIVVNVHADGKVWLDLWESCGKCRTKELVVDVIKGRMLELK